MSESPHFSLPYLAAAQAQKHVTMNEALARLDALAAPTALSADISAPPETVAEGDVYLIPEGASGAWAGRADQIAFQVNGGWRFATPRPGWRVWVQDRAGAAVWSGAAWIFDLVGSARAGAALTAASTEGDVSLSGGAVVTPVVLPDRAVVIGVTARVLNAVTGASISGWRLGVAGSDNRYGSNIGLAAGAVANGVTSAPVAYFADTPLLITAEGGAFTGGVVRLSAHYLALSPPTAL